MYAGQVVESGPARDVLSAPMHPYPMGLYNAFPDLARAEGELTPIEGSPPDLSDPPPGCRFAPRCPFAEARCTATPPPLAAVGDGHLAGCWRVADAAELRRKAAEVATWQR